MTKKRAIPIIWKHYTKDGTLELDNAKARIKTRKGRVDVYVYNEKMNKKHHIHEFVGKKGIGSTITKEAKNKDEKEHTPLNKENLKRIQE